MKSQLFTFNITGSNNLRIALLCIIVLITSNGFSQNHFVKRKYMKGVFVEKKQKTNDRDKKHLKTTIFAQKKSDILKDTVVVRSNTKDATEIAKDDCLANLVIFETPVKRNIEIVKSKAINSSAKSYSKHNTIHPDTTLQCSNSTTVLLAKKVLLCLIFLISVIKKQ